MKKMKVFCFVGSNNQYSLGAYVADCLEEALRKKNFEVSFYKGNQCEINLCKGCSLCFAEGRCPLDETDIMKEIKRDMIEADVIFWISPVYANNVSGMMKNYIDRTSEWLHTIELSGKLGGVIAITDNSGEEFVNFYMKRLLSFLGCNVVVEEAIVKTRMEKTIEDIIRSIVSKIEEAFQQGKQYQSNEIQEAYFKAVQERFKHIIDNNEANWKKLYEPRYWYEKKMIDSENFQEVLGMKQKKQIQHN